MNKKQNSHKTGLLAEWVAILWLFLKGYIPLAVRFKTPVGEIDYIGRKGKTLAIIEIKYRSTLESAASAISEKSQRRIYRAAEWFLKQNAYSGYNLRFDALCLAPWRMPKHIKNAWSISH